MNKIEEKVNKLQYNSPVILTFTLLSFFAFGLNYITKGKANVLLFSVYRSSFTDPLMYVRVFTHVLGHFSFDHLFSNFMIILLVGPFLEEKYGSIRLLFMILLTSVTTGIIHMIFAKDTMLLGASGIVFMMMLLSSFVNLQHGKIPLTLILSATLFLGREIIASLTSTDNISRSTHIVGGILGALFGYFYNRKQLKELEPAPSLATKSDEKQKLKDKKPLEEYEKALENTTKNEYNGLGSLPLNTEATLTKPVSSHKIESESSKKENV